MNVAEISSDLNALVHIHALLNDRNWHDAYEEHAWWRRVYTSEVTDICTQRVQDITTRAQDCSSTHCSGHGRCASLNGSSTTCEFDRMWTGARCGKNSKPIREYSINVGLKTDDRGRRIPPGARRIGTGRAAFTYDDFWGAAQMGQGLVVREMLQSGAEVDAQDTNGENALILAAGAGQKEIVKSLVIAGAKVNLQTQRGATAVLVAAQYGHTSVIRVLLSGGADPELKDFAGATPLALAAQQGHASTVALLLEAGVHPDQKDSAGQTGLSIAAKKNSIGVAEVLIAHGADLEVLNRRSQSPIQLAMAMENYELAKLLLEAGAKADRNLAERINSKVKGSARQRLSAKTPGRNDQHKQQRQSKQQARKIGEKPTHASGRFNSDIDVVLQQKMLENPELFTSPEMMSVMSNMHDDPLAVLRFVEANPDLAEIFELVHPGILKHLGVRLPTAKVIGTAPVTDEVIGKMSVKELKK